MIDNAIIYGFLALVCAVLVLVILLPQKPHVRVHRELLDEEQRDAALARLRPHALDRSGDVQSISNRRRP